LLAAIALPVCVIRGGASHPAVQRANALLGDCLNGTLATIDGAAHFMIATHADAVARLIA
jgi:pimeloyl-ACP methyl ester carboxylesterase